MMKRHEFVFLYDVSWANPNGDPLAENEPRQDRVRERVLVSDERIKRTVRDTLEEMGHEIFVKGEYTEDGALQTKEEKMRGRKPEELLRTYIDLRLFGGVFAVKSKGKKEETEENTKAFSLVGPVQMAWGESLHRAEVVRIKGTTVMPSGEGKSRGTMTEEFKVPYALIGTYGVVNEKNAEKTFLTEEDLELFFKALWWGHSAGRVLETSSKLGHAPRLLIDLVYSQTGYYAPVDLISCIKVIPQEELDEKSLRKITELTIDLSELKKVVERRKPHILKVRYEIDPLVRFSEPLEKVFDGCSLERFSF